MPMGTKVVFMGGERTGKTALLRKAVLREQYDFVTPTIGVEYLVHQKEGESDLAIWDLAGAERYNAMRPSYLKKVDIVVYCFDLSKSIDDNKKSFLSNSGYLKNLDPPPTIVFVGTKNDATISTDLSELCTQIKTLFSLTFNEASYSTSAKNGEGVEKLFAALHAIAKPLEALKKEQLPVADPMQEAINLVHNEAPLHAALVRFQKQIAGLPKEDKEAAGRAAKTLVETLQADALPSEKESAIDEFYTNVQSILSKTKPGIGMRILKAAAVVLAAAVICLLVGMICFGIGAAVFGWTGPGALVTGVIAGVKGGMLAASALAGVVGGVVTAKKLSKSVEDEVVEEAKKYRP